MLMNTTLKPFAYCSQTLGIHLDMLFQIVSKNNFVSHFLLEKFVLNNLWFSFSAINGISPQEEKMPNSFTRNVSFIRHWVLRQSGLWMESTFLSPDYLGWIHALPFSRRTWDNLPSVLQFPHLLSSCCDNLVN